MSQTNSFPQNILTALDALAELGKAVQNKKQHEQTIHSQMTEEKDQDAEGQAVKGDRNQKQAGK